MNTGFETLEWTRKESSNQVSPSASNAPSVVMEAKGMRQENHLKEIHERIFEKK